MSNTQVGISSYLTIDKITVTICVMWYTPHQVICQHSMPYLHSVNTCKQNMHLEKFTRQPAPPKSSGVVAYENNISYNSRGPVVSPHIRKNDCWTLAQLHVLHYTPLTKPFASCRTPQLRSPSKTPTRLPQHTISNATHPWTIGTEFLFFSYSGFLV